MPDDVTAVIVGLFALMVASFGYMIYLTVTAHKSEDGNDKKAFIASFVDCTQRWDILSQRQRENV